MASVSSDDDAEVFMNNFDLQGVTPALGGLIRSVRELERQISQSAMTGPQIVAEFAELYPPVPFFAPDIRSTPIVYKALRDWLNENGANLPVHSTRRVLMQLAANLYSDDEERQAAEAIIKDIINAGRRVNRSAIADDQKPDRPAQADGPGGQDKLAYYIGMRFRDKESKFSGDLGESWMEFVAEYQQVARDYSLSPPQKKQYLHNLLRGDAKRFYLDRVTTTVKNHLSGLRLSKYTSEGLDDLAALERVYKLITKLSPQVPMSHRSEAHKIEFLRNSTVGTPWATEPLSRVA
eukprot:IDg22660t1